MTDNIKPIGVVVLSEDGTPMVKWNAGLDLDMELYALKPRLVAWHINKPIEGGIWRELSYEQKEGFTPLYELEK